MTTKNNYLLFAGEDYYPNGGAEDIQGAFETLSDAVDFHKPNEFDYDGGWANVLNVSTLGVEARFNRGDWVYHVGVKC